MALGHTPAGASTGSLAAPEALLRAAGELLAAGCDALAVVARFPEEEDEEEEEERDEGGGGGDGEASGRDESTGKSGGGGGGGGGVSAQLAEYRQGGGVDALAGAQPATKHTRQD